MKTFVKITVEPSCVVVLTLSNTMIKTIPDSLFENNLRGPLAVHSEAAIRQFDYGAHGLADGVESVDFVKLLFWELVSYWLVIPLQVQDQSQQAAFCLVSHLFRQTAFLIWRLEGSRGNVYLKARFDATEQHSLPDHDFLLRFLLYFKVLMIPKYSFHPSFDVSSFCLNCHTPSLTQTFTDLCSSSFVLLCKVGLQIAADNNWLAGRWKGHSGGWAGNERWNPNGMFCFHAYGSSHCNLDICCF